MLAVIVSKFYFRREKNIGILLVLGYSFKSKTPLSKLRDLFSLAGEGDLT